MKVKVLDVPRQIEGQRRSGESWAEIFRVPAMSLGIYSLKVGEEDTQTPHAEDEIYYVLSGSGAIRVEGEDHPVRPGALVFVAARAKHKFHSIREDLTVMVIFAPAEDVEAARGLA
jgi:mannose-6-phosphate isomerase-like protein (cupin superfamily)